MSRSFFEALISLPPFYSFLIARREIEWLCARLQSRTFLNQQTLSIPVHNKKYVGWIRRPGTEEWRFGSDKKSVLFAEVAASEDEEDKEIGYEPMIDDLKSIAVGPKWLLPEMVRP
jgi:hypothetical protein